MAEDIIQNTDATQTLLSPEGKELYDFCQEGVTWITGRGTKRTSYLANAILQAFGGDIEKAHDYFLKSWWGIKRDYDRLDAKGKARWDATTYSSRIDCVVEGARRKLLVGSQYGYYYLIPYNTWENYKPTGGELTLSITQHGIIEVLIRNGIIRDKKDFPVWDVYEGDIVEIDRTDPMNDRLVKFVQRPFASDVFLGCLAQVSFPDGTTRIYTKPKSYFDEAMARTKNIEEDKETKTKKIKDDSPWVSFYIEMCHKTMRKGIVNEFAQSCPEVSAVVDYDNKTQFAEKNQLPQQVQTRTDKFNRIKDKWSGKNGQEQEQPNDFDDGSHIVSDAEMEEQTADMSNETKTIVNEDASPPTLEDIQKRCAEHGKPPEPKTISEFEQEESNG